MPKFNVNIQIEASSFILFTDEDAIEAETEKEARAEAISLAKDSFMQGEFDIDRCEITAIEQLPAENYEEDEE